MANDSPVSPLNQIDLCSSQDPENIFTLEKMVGSGSYGQVYKASRMKTREPAAIKIINVNMVNLEDLKSEINLLKTQSHHRNIVEYYGAFIKKGASSVPSGDQLWVSGLAHLHKYKIMHRDIKGQNVLLTERAEVKLVDFGVSKQSESTISKQNTFIGTPYWMAPEVINCNRDPNGAYDCKSDVWSSGITAIEMAEGKPPLCDMSPFQAMSVIVHDEAPTLSPGNWSANFQSFIHSCLVKDPSKRLSATELLKHAFISNIQKHIRHIRHEIIDHRNKQKEEQWLAEEMREAEAEQMERGSALGNSPPRHAAPSPKMSQEDKNELNSKLFQEYVKRKEWEDVHVKREMERQLKILHNYHPHDEKILPSSPNLKRNRARSSHVPHYSAQPQKNRQPSRSPSSPMPVPQIFLPQKNVDVKLKSRSPDSRKHVLKNYNSLNADSDHDCKRRSTSASPNRRGGQGSYRDENGNRLRNMMRMSSSHEDVQNLRVIDLSSSAPEHSLRQMKNREQRLHSVPQGNFLDVPQHMHLTPVCYTTEKENSRKGSLSSSCQDLSVYKQNNLEFVKLTRNLSNSICGQDFLAMPDILQKSKHGVVNSVKALVRHLGLSPRTSPQRSPVSSRSPSPGSSPTPSTLYDSPFSPTADWPARPS
ncbi:hypothetical protein QTP86_032742 [Hemibagrus guttatus]|nr:hypothetical protein QTP86_032742 [Hemibagrus guttatus]